MDRESAISLLRKLLEHQKSAAAIGSQAEAEAFAERIQELLTKHQLDEATILSYSPDDAKKVQFKRVCTGAKLKSKMEMWQHVLMTCIAQANFCRAIGVNGQNVVEIIGHPDDVEVVSEMYTFLNNTALNLSEVMFRKFYNRVEWNDYLLKNNYTPTWGSRVWRNSFHSGFVTGIASRLKERQRKVLDQGTQTALVFVGDRIKRANELAEQRFPRIVNKVSKRRYSMDAYNQGLTHGKSATMSNRNQVELI